jgi:anti-sigma B factor antagonist
MSAEVHQPVSANQRAEMQSFIEFCLRVGLQHVALGFNKPRSMQTVMLLMALRQDFERMTIEAVALDDLALDHAGTDGKCNRLAGGACDEYGVSEYCVRLCDMEQATEHIGQIIPLLGTSLGLDDDTLSLLRLCLYELAVNTVEHAHFADGPGEIQAKIITRPNKIDLTYCDNSAEFSTSDHDHVDITKKMKNGDKRGLGLFMLHQISSNLRYRRRNEWNETTFQLKRSAETSDDFARRKRMTTLSMEVTGVDSSDAVVIKTKGSINSNTAPALDAEFDDLIAKQSYTIIVDLEATDFISSSGIGVLLGTVTTLRDKGGDLILMNLPKIVSDIFDILNIKSYFRVIDSVEELQAESR